jgi:hypothetical protein
VFNATFSNISVITLQFVSSTVSSGQDSGDRDRIHR